MPFSCSADRGRVELTPSPERSYAVLDRRYQQPFTACFGTDPANCRTWMVHRFSIDCGGTPVAWVDVVAAAAPYARMRVSADNGRLVVAPHRADRARGRDCFESAARGDMLDECWRQTPAQSPGRELTLPAGFAPAALVGARFVLPNPQPARAMPISATSNPWVTELVTEADPEQPLQAGRPHPLQHHAYAIVGAVAMLLTLAVLLWRRLHPAVALVAAPASSRTSTPDPDVMFVETLLETGAAGLKEIEARLQLLSGALPLRQVLKRELRAVQQRLAALCRERPASEGERRRLKLRLQSIVQDVARLKEIADGAHRSLTGADEVLAPRDRSEAYVVLGVNADVDERIVKKLVDALRQSWHPDHARDAEDRRQREERIKQINIAWDLISGKRVEA